MVNVRCRLLFVLDGFSESADSLDVAAGARAIAPNVNSIPKPASIEDLFRFKNNRSPCPALRRARNMLRQYCKTYHERKGYWSAYEFLQLHFDDFLIFLCARTRQLIGQ